MPFVDMNKEFIGKDALMGQMNVPAKWKLTTLTIEATTADCIGNEPVFYQGEVVGITTSGGYGHHVGKSIALAYVKPEFILPEFDLQVEILGDVIKAKNQATCLFDANGERLRA